MFVAIMINFIVNELWYSYAFYFIIYNILYIINYYILLCTYCYLLWNNPNFFFFIKPMSKRVLITVVVYNVDNKLIIMIREIIIVYIIIL